MTQKNKHNLRGEMCQELEKISRRSVSQGIKFNRKELSKRAFTKNRLILRNKAFEILLKLFKETIEEEIIGQEGLFSIQDLLDGKVKEYLMKSHTDGQQYIDEFRALQRSRLNTLVEG